MVPPSVAAPPAAAGLGCGERAQQDQPAQEWCGLLRYAIGWRCRGGRGYSWPAYSVGTVGRGPAQCPTRGPGAASSAARSSARPKGCSIGDIATRRVDCIPISGLLRPVSYEISIYATLFPTFWYEYWRILAHIGSGDTNCSANSKHLSMQILKIRINV